MNKEKQFDSVKMMRSIREEVQREREENPKLMEERLKEIRKKYHIKEEVQTEKTEA
ncbi:MAG: hypothetical protein IPN76_21405 [Saprospiraceae bacterium]|jgi:hypothetical protein|nr:hypothetical protein [Saprospiraceae bacterium]